VVRAIRDYLRPDINEVLIDDEGVYQQAREFTQKVLPQNLSRIKLHRDRVPLFTRFQIESQIETVFQRQVPLSSGGAVVIDRAEAMVAIDVNSGRATKGGDIEETALNTNLEAADEIARQLRLRDLGGLIVIDFIDMAAARNQRQVENHLRDALKADRARVQVGHISRFGLLEMSRQRLGTSLGESSHTVCPRCEGEGHIRTVESLALSVLRLLQEEAIKDRTGRVIAQLPVSTATYLLNEKRGVLERIEAQHGISVVLVPDPGLDTPHYRLQRVRLDDVEASSEVPSYELTTPPEEATEPLPLTAQPVLPEPIVKDITPTAPAPPPRETTSAPDKPTPGFIRRLWATLFGTSGAEPEPELRSRAVTHPTRPRAHPHAGASGRRGRARRGSGRPGTRPGAPPEGVAAPRGAAREQHRRRPDPTTASAAGETSSAANLPQPIGGSRRDPQPALAESAAPENTTVERQDTTTGAKAQPPADLGPPPTQAPIPVEGERPREAAAEGEAGSIERPSHAAKPARRRPPRRRKSGGGRSAAAKAADERGAAGVGEAAEGAPSEEPAVVETGDTHSAGNA
jgi:ribonuclease E